jgi:sugar-specific transcriptional regulator TrmB
LITKEVRVVYNLRMIEKFLTDLGFSEKEIEVYLKLLSVNDATVTELARMTAINRTTLYPILEQLLEKKIVLEVDKGKKARFQAEPPERLATYIQN